MPDLRPCADRAPSAPAKKPLAVLIGTGAAATLIAFVGSWEGKRNDPYQDIVGVWTVCYGETRAPMRHYTDAECSEMLGNRLTDYAAPVLARNPELKGHDNQVVAASSLSYNIGAANYARSTVAKRFSAGRWREACDAFLAWGGVTYSKKQPGKVCVKRTTKPGWVCQVSGLLNRRKAERAVCLRGL
ncbi:lysozyme [Novosphingobium colocasiae]|uniref:lysozyme n=1 Tax=Novosphingobium colocasiae TaxID=1256513 RepID=UPI0035B39C6F